MSVDESRHGHETDAQLRFALQHPDPQVKCRWLAMMGFTEEEAEKRLRESEEEKIRHGR